MTNTVRPLRIINAVAPIRICDNGGWTDTWFAGHGKIFNIGVYPYAEVQIQVYPYDKGSGGRSGRHPCGELRRPLRARPEHDRLAEASPAGSRDPPDEGARGYGDPPHDLLRGARRRVDGHVRRSQRGARRRARPADARPADAARGRVHGLGDRDRGTGPAVGHPGPACVGLRRDQLHRDVPVSDRVRVAHPGVQRGLVGARTPAGADLPGQVPLLVARARKGDPGAGRRRPASPRLEALRTTAERSRDAVYEGDWAALGRGHGGQHRRAGAVCTPNSWAPNAWKIIEIAKEHGALGWKVNGAGGDGGSVAILCGEMSSAKRAMIRELEQENPHVAAHSRSTSAGRGCGRGKRRAAAEATALPQGAPFLT